MKKIYVFGVGKGRNIVEENINAANVELLGYVDNHAEAYAEGLDGKKVLLPEDIGTEFDFIVVSVMRYKYVNQQLLTLGVKKEKIINFFSFEDSATEEYWAVLNKNGWRLEAFFYDYEKRMRPLIQNSVYETADRRFQPQIKYPNILPAEKAVEKIRKEKKSLVRFGDGEFELMRMRRRARFQSAEAELAGRLREILRSNEENILIAIADNYGSLEKYTEEAAESIREYLTPEVRREHMELLMPDQVYYDAYLSRPYMIYKEKEKAGKRFGELKKIWEGRDVLVVEGDRTRMGVGNDLFDNVRSLRRILAPGEDAFHRYDEILSAVKQQTDVELVLAALGPTASVLSYDLAVSGMWAVDIGHLDLEYEWYHSSEKEKRRIPYKYVQEVDKGDQVDEIPESLKEKYDQEILISII